MSLHLHRVDVILILILESTDIESVACAQPPQLPVNVGAYPVSSSEVLVVLDKPIGDGYDFKISYSGGPGITLGTQGPLGYGTAWIQVISSLQPDYEYEFQVEMSCEHSSSYSQPISVIVKTLPVG